MGQRTSRTKYSHVHGETESCIMYITSTQPSNEMHWKMVIIANMILSKLFTPLGLRESHTHNCDAGQERPEQMAESAQQRSSSSISFGDNALATALVFSHCKLTLDVLPTAGHVLSAAAGSEISAHSA